MSYFVRKLNGYSRNTFKLQTLNQSQANANSIITFDLPNGALVDLNTLCWWFKGSTSTTNSGATPPGFATFGRNIESIIERVEIEIGGQTIQGGFNSYNQLWQIISDTSFGEDCANRRKILQNAADVGAPAANVSAVQYCVNNWLGLLGSIKPEVLDKFVSKKMTLCH